MYEQAKPCLQSILLWTSNLFCKDRVPHDVIYVALLEISSCALK